MHQSIQTLRTSHRVGDEFFESFDLIDPLLEEWVQSSASLATKFSSDIAGKNRSALVYHSMIVQITADYIWHTEKPLPGWNKLDVDGFERNILQDRLALDDIAKGNFNLTLSAFYTWQERNSYLSEDDASQVITCLQNYDNRYVLNMLQIATFTSSDSSNFALSKGAGSYLLRRTLMYTNG